MVRSGKIKLHTLCPQEENSTLILNREAVSAALVMEIMACADEVGAEKDVFFCVLFVRIQ